MRHRTLRDGLLWRTALLISCGLAVPLLPARAEVLDIAADGSIRVRHGNGAVVWEGIDVATDPADGGPDLQAGPDGTGWSGLIDPVPAADLSPTVWRGPLRSAAGLAGISPALLEALVWQESRWSPGARSSAGAIGLGQLMPRTARQLGVDPRDPAANLAGAARYLRQQLDRFDGNIELALAAYNAGPERVARRGAVPAIAETRAYVRAITARLARAAKGQD